MSSSGTGEDDVLMVCPRGEVTCAVLVLAGSSGRVERDRVHLLARHGAVALSMRWFGGEGQPAGICEVPLETFGPALDRLADRHERLVVIGSSKGAEAALLLASRDDRIAAVASFAPSSVSWGNVGRGVDGIEHPYRSSWTEAGVPVPFVPYDDGWRPTGSPPAFRGLYEQSLRAFPAEAEAAEIPVERIRGDVLVAAGADDRVWPSDRFAAAIHDRRQRHGLTTTVLIGEGAGHRVLLPGEPPARGGAVMARGGGAIADAAFGQRIWRELRFLLPLR